MVIRKYLAKDRYTVLGWNLFSEMERLGVKEITIFIVSFPLYLL